MAASVIPEFDTHICLISNQAAANLLPVTEPRLEPKHAVLVVSPEMKDKAYWFRLALKEVLPQLSVETLELASAFDLGAMMDAFFGLFDRLQTAGHAPLLNVTGGTKPMAIAALRAAECADAPSFYLELERNAVTFLSKERTTIHLERRQNLKAYLLAYGLKLKKPEPSAVPFTAELKALTERLIRTPSYKANYGQINWLAAEAGKSELLTADCSGLHEGAQAILDEFERSGLLTVRGRNVRFSGEAARFFVNGGWLEAYAANVAQSTFPDSKVISNAKIEVLPNVRSSATDKPVENELDVLFWAREHLCVMECKTSNLSGDERVENVIYKVSSIEQNFGKKVIPMLLSYKPLSDTARSRAKSCGIRVVAGDDLKRLPERLKHFVNGAAQ